MGYLKNKEKCNDLKKEMERKRYEYEEKNKEIV